MDKGVWFWIIYVIFVLLGFFLSWPAAPYEPKVFRPFGFAFVVFVLIFLLGWGVYGPPIR